MLHKQSRSILGRGVLQGLLKQARRTVFPRVQQQTHTAATVVASPPRRYERVPRFFQTRFRHDYSCHSAKTTRLLPHSYRPVRVRPYPPSNEHPSRFSYKTRGARATKMMAFESYRRDISIFRRIARRMHPPRCREISVGNFVQGGVLSYHPGVIISY